MQNPSNIIIILQFIFFPISVLVRCIYRLRRYLYTINYYHSKKFNLPTISIGNIALGGSGKTPFLKWLILRLQENNKKLLISSRGHLSESENVGKIINSIDTKIMAKEIGDENKELLAVFNNGLLAVGKKRTELISQSLKKTAFDYLILDDGFQHLKIDRDKNIILINSLLPKNQYHVFPSGYLREGISSLFEADIIVMTNCQSVRPTLNEQNIVKLINPFLKPDTKIFRSKTIISHFENLKTRESIPLEKFNDGVVAVSGIAGAEKFHELVQSNNVKIHDKLDFRDHHLYSELDYDKIKLLGSKFNVPVLITEKDSVKFNPEKISFECYVCHVKLDFYGQDEELLKRIIGE